MSPFAEAVAILGAQGIPVIPTRQEAPSRPLVSNPGAFGVPASRKLAESPKFAHANAGVWTGQRSGLTIVDVDSPDEAMLHEAIAVFGDSPVKVQTPSGGWHLYFRHNGERRRVKPHGKGLPVDVLGGGLAAIPPSSRAATEKKAAGDYRVIEGSLSDLSRLPRLKPGSLPNLATSPVNTGGIRGSDLGGMREGDGRDNALFAIARNAAGSCNSLDDLRLIVRAENARMAEPLPDSIADAKAAVAWQYKLEHRLMPSGTQAAIMDIRATQLTLPYPPSCSMLVYLRCQHGYDHIFALVPDAICIPLSMSPGTARKARDFLLAAELIELIELGGLTPEGKRPNLYRLKPSAKI